MSDTVLPPTLSVDHLRRADMPTIWEGFHKQALEFRALAETLTVTDPSEVSKMRLARETRLALRQVRLAVDTRRKELKEDSLRECQKIDTCARWLKELIEPWEKRLQEQEDFVIRMDEQRRAQLLEDRQKQLGEIEGACCETRQMVELSEEMWQQVLARSRSEVMERKAQADAESLRMATEAAERSRLAAENARLREEQRVAQNALETARRETASKVAAEEAAKLHLLNAPAREKLLQFAEDVATLTQQRLTENATAECRVWMLQLLARIKQHAQTL